MRATTPSLAGAAAQINAWFQAGEDVALNR
jgi:hypothetical protein